MQVLVLGGTRFIGRAIVEHLLRAGHEVTLLNRGRAEDPFGTRVRRVLGDRRERETIHRAAAKQEYEVVVDVTAYREEETASVVETFRDRIAHLVHISTAAVYLVRDNLFPPFREIDFVGRLGEPSHGEEGAWQYAVRKRRCEELLREAWEEHRFPYTSLRLPMVVGEHDYTRRADAYLERIASGGPLVLPEGGLNSWGFLWVEDLAEAVAATVANSGAFGRAFNLAQREAISVRRFVELAASLLGRTVELVSLPSAWLRTIGLGTDFSPYSHQGDILLDCNAAHQELLFRPTETPRWLESVIDGFRRRWDGVLRSFAHSRAFELSLAREVARIRLPSYGGARATGA